MAPSAEENMSAFIGGNFKVPVNLNCKLEQGEAMWWLLRSWGWQ